MLLPGPEAQQLATYIGWLMHRTLGGVVAGRAVRAARGRFDPGAGMVYALYGSVGPVAALFYGIKPAVMAIVVQAVMRLGRRALRNDDGGAGGGGVPVADLLLGVPFPVVVLAAAARRRGAGRGCGRLPAGGGRAAAAGAAQGRFETASATGCRFSPAGCGAALRVGAVSWRCGWCRWRWWPGAGLGGTFARIAVFFSRWRW